MRIDTHCHIDLFDDPIAMVKNYEKEKTICVLATLLPSHFQVALPYLKLSTIILPALAIHPLRAREGKDEIKLFMDLASSSRYIGEIGMDLSAEGRNTKEIQLAILKHILPAIGSGKFVTVHSRNAHEELSDVLDEHGIGPVCFHYFIGGPRAAERLAAKGHYFSINHCMLTSKHRELLDAVQRDRILVESDGPFLTRRPLAMVKSTYAEISRIWQMDLLEAEGLLFQNFNRCRTKQSQG